MINPKLSREELRLKMVELQNEAHQYRNAIEIIDKKAREEQIKKVFGKCFRKDEHEVFVITKITNDYSYQGISIFYYENSSQYPNLELHSQIDNHCTIYEDTIKESEEISRIEFITILKQVIKSIEQNYNTILTDN